MPADEVPFKGGEMRQTDLSFDELISIFHDPKGCTLPLCMIANEIGELAKENDDRAYEKLLGFLKAKDPSLRFIACGWLKECDNPAALEGIYELLKTEKNERVIEMAMEAKNHLEIVLGWSVRN